MNKEFEPYYKDRDKDEFTDWDYKKHEGATPIINKEEEFQKECEALRQAAITKGYEEGMLKAAAELQEKKEELSDWIKFIQNPAALLDDNLTQEIIQTVIWLGTYCIGVELSVHPEKLRELFNHIKDELPSLQGNKVFAMNPEDISWIKTELSVSDVPGLHEILVEDPLLSRGDFYLKSEHSELDGRIQTRLITLFAKYINKDNLVTPIPSQD